MKAGDKVWVRVTFEGTEPDGMERFYHQPCGDDLAPDHPALPAVARWLAEDTRHVSLLGEIVAAAVKRGALSEEEDVRLHWLSSALTE